MSEAFLLYTVCTALGILGGLCAGFGLRWGVSRRCYKLEVQLLDLQRVLLSVKGQAGAEKRWKQRDLLDDASLRLAGTQEQRERFANDPLNYG
jgi:hypothetical protein